MHDTISFSFTLDALGYGAEPVDRPPSQSPEHALMRAVLADAVHQVQKHAHKDGRRAQRLFRESRAWLWSNDASWPFSAWNICEALGIDVDYLRRGLAAKIKEPRETYRRASREHGRNSHVTVQDVAELKMKKAQGQKEYVVKMKRAA